MGDLKSADWTLLLLIAVGSLRIPGSHACNTAGIVYIRDQLMALWYPTHLAGERATIPEELKRRQQGCRAGLKQRIKKRRYTPYIPAVITGNMRSLANKVDKLEALARTQREHREPSIMCFTDTWLHEQIPDSNVTIPGFQTVRADRDTAATGKKKGGGLAVLVNNRWCNPRHDSAARTSSLSLSDFVHIICRGSLPVSSPSLFTFLHLGTQ